MIKKRATTDTEDLESKKIDNIISVIGGVLGGRSHPYN